MSNHPNFYPPGHPSTTRYIDQISLISGLCDRPTTMYVTASHWGEIIAELDAQYRQFLLDPAKPAPWDKGTGSALVMGDLTVVNSGTDDQLVVNLRNQTDPGAIDFIARRDRLRIA